MSITPRPLPPEDNVNISQRQPIKELGILLGGTLGCLLAIYLVLGFTVDLALPYLPVSAEQRLGDSLAQAFPQTDSTQEQKLQVLLDQVVAQEHASPPYPFKLHYLDDDTVNAMAIPGGHILFFKGLVENAKSENELAFIMGHELGHLYHRHNLRSMGRGLVIFTLSEILLGSDNFLSGFVQNGFQSLQMRFSQSQELEADQMGLKLLAKKYGHVGGATDFFKSQAKDSSHFASYFSSHPHPEKRIEYLSKTIQEKHYVKRALVANTYAKEEN